MNRIKGIAEFLDLGARFQELLGEKRYELHLSDGIHVDSEGHRLMAKIIGDALNASM